MLDFVALYALAGVAIILAWIVIAGVLWFGMKLIACIPRFRHWDAERSTAEEIARLSPRREP